MFEIWTLRLLGAGGFGVLGWRLGAFVTEFSSDEKQVLPWGIVLALTGVPVGALVAPYLTLKPWRKGVNYLNSIPGSTMLSGTLGTLIGLIFAALISIPLYTLSGWWWWCGHR